MNGVCNQIDDMLTELNSSNSIRPPRKHKMLAQRTLAGLDVCTKTGPHKKMKMNSSYAASSTEEEFSPAPAPPLAPDTDTQMDNIFERMSDSFNLEQPSTVSEHSNNIFDLFSSAASDNSETGGSSSSKTCLLHVKEIYQEAFLLDETQTSIVLAPSSAPLETSFELPADMDAEGCLDISVSFPPRLLVQLDESPIVDVTDRRVEEALEMQCEEESPTDLVVMVECYNKTVSLRRRVFRLLTNLIPDLVLVDRFNCVSAHTDILLDYTLESLRSHEDEDLDTTDLQLLQLYTAEPLVQLCSNPLECLDRLRARVLELLAKLLPALTLPAEFSIEDDLENLLHDISECSK